MFEDEKVLIEKEKTVLTLGDKIKELIEKYEKVCEQNEELRNDLTTQKAQNEALKVQLSKLEEDMVLKNLTEEDLFQQIEDVLKK